MTDLRASRRTSWKCREGVVRDSIAHEGRARAYDCFHRHFFDGREYAQLATEHGVDASVIAADIRHAMRRTRAATESILREELGSADPHLIAAELERIRALTGRRL